MEESRRRVLVTGTDTMLGAAVQSAFSARGAYVVGTCQPPTDSQKVASSSIVVELTDPEQVQTAVRRAADSMGGIDTLVAAHALPLIATLDELDMDAFWGHVDAALTGTFLMAQAAAGLMRGAGTGGRMVLTTSRWHIGGHGLSAVAAAAGGVVALTKTLTRDFGRLGIGVNAVAVGCVDSEWSICDAADSDSPAPAGRGTVTQVAGLIEVLSRPSLGAAVGQIVNVDGGSSRNRV